MNKKTFAIAIVVLALGIGATLAYPGAKPQTNAAMDDFAKCLASSGAAMYGADWCPHCQNEKKAFGDSFKFINYVECSLEPQRCLEAGINGYPTWVFPDSRKLVGEQGLEKLSAETGCSLP